MLFPSECCQIHQILRQTMPQLTEAQSKGLALWTFGTITAQSGRQNSVIAALTFTGGFSAVRQRLREWLYGGAAQGDCRALGRVRRHRNGVPDGVPRLAVAARRGGFPIRAA